MFDARRRVAVNACGATKIPGSFNISRSFVDFFNSLSSLSYFCNALYLLDVVS